MRKSMLTLTLSQIRTAHSSGQETPAPLCSRETLASPKIPFSECRFLAPPGSLAMPLAFPPIEKTLALQSKQPVIRKQSP